MIIKVMGRADIENFSSDKKHIIISIIDPNSEPIIFPENKGLIATLFLEFHDLDKRAFKKDCPDCGGTGKIEKYKDINNGHCYSCTDKMDIILFKERDANQILDFVSAFKDDIEMIVVNCEAGISRSAGVASALSKIINGNDQYYFDHYIPNRLVYSTILNCYFNHV